MFGTSAPYAQIVETDLKIRHVVGRSDSENEKIKPILSLLSKIENSQLVFQLIPPLHIRKQEEVSISFQTPLVLLTECL
ncbi:MAG: hypothetical protein ACH350_01395 [Parachlamydiaceae bacterium]